MDRRDPPLATDVLWDQLFEAPSFERFVSDNQEEIGLPSFSEYIRVLCRQKGEAAERVIRRANIERSYGHQIFRGSRRPSRDTVLQLAFGFGADLPQVQALLKHAGHSPLYPRIERDAAIGYCLHHRMSLIDAQSVLAELRVPLIGGSGGLKWKTHEKYGRRPTFFVEDCGE